MGRLKPDQQAPVFTARRPEIECVASQKYDCGQLRNGVTVVGVRDLRDAEVLK
jgi:hypothetical protein